ncbi:MAG: anti-sigma factor family protein [bacterium]
MNNDKDQKTRKGCLDEELLSRYIYNRVSDEERANIEGHLSQCALCVDEVIFATRCQDDIVNEGAWLQVPQQLQRRILDLVKERKTKKKEIILHICLRFFQEKLDILHHNGILIPQPALAVRSAKDVAAHSKKAFYKSIQGYHIEAEIKKSSNTEIDILVRIEGPPEKPALTNVCFTLCKMDSHSRPVHVLEEMIRDREARFKGLESGEYCIKIAHNKKEIGSVQIDLRD